MFGLLLLIPQVPVSNPIEIYEAHIVACDSADLLAMLADLSHHIVLGFTFFSAHFYYCCETILFVFKRPLTSGLPLQVAKHNVR